MAITINADTSNGLVMTPDTSGEIKLQSAGADKVTITSAGNVGIGTSSPTVKLQVGDNTVNSSNRIVFGLSQASSATFLPAISHKTTGSAANDLALGAGGGGGGIAFYTGTATNSGEIGTGSSTLKAYIDNIGNLLFNSGYGSVATAYGCRAWINFNGTGTIAIRGSGNVSSITDLAVGNYRVTFSTAMPSDDYCVTSAGGEDDTAGGNRGVGIRYTTTSYVELRGWAAASSAVDLAEVCVAIHR